MNDVKAETTAEEARRADVRDAAASSVIRDVYGSFKKLKERVEAKSMPKPKGPPDIPSTTTASASTAATGTSTPTKHKGPPAPPPYKPPPAKMKESPASLRAQLQERPSAAKKATGTTVKLEPRQPDTPPPKAGTTARSSTPNKIYDTRPTRPAPSPP